MKVFKFNNDAKNNYVSYYNIIITINLKVFDTYLTYVRIALL